jgi:prophage regulatory protein
MLNQLNKALRILRMRQITEKLNLGRSAIYDRLDARSPRHDPTFPRPVTLGGGRAIGFVESEVDDWLAAQISKRNKAA